MNGDISRVRPTLNQINVGSRPSVKVEVISRRMQGG